MSLLKLCQSSTKTIVFKCTESQGLYISARKLSIVPSIYDGENPAPKFFSSGVQIILKRLTRPNFEKVFRKRTNSNISVLRTPVYKFLTDEELKIEQSNAYKSAERLLQMPPVVKVQEPVDDILSKDPALVGYDSSTYLFTDITYGVANEHRLIIQREPDGTLRSCDHDVRKKLNQIYFPMQGRKLRDPLVFSDPEKFNSLLDRQKYEYILDRACVQYEPDDPQYQKLTSITYQHVDMNNQYNLIRSTRHFGPLAFYLTWHDSIDNLMLEMVQTGIIREAVLLMSLRQAIKEDLVNGEESTALVSEILPTRIQLRKPDYVSEDDIQLDTKCMECLDKYINNNSAMKSQQGLALQGFREYYQQLIEISRGLQKAHGSA
ncbi:small ribosomal subunit protein mS22 isoform X1 [Danaus plexippus]|uniref:small ribosomal subunit protein mS22 isoform X1 n=1 Tax=Danaus plexippus TaxID=13037 RepID=UPI002AB310F1|nr:small ribosomal subunit protein mS22 isoform X1 [Danaus plexippus]